MAATNVFNNRAWDWDVDCLFRSLMTEMGLNMDDANQAFIVATGWRKQVTENMAEAVEANDPRVHGFLAFQEDPWYRTDAQGVYDPKKSFLRFAFEQAPMEVGVHQVGFIKIETSCSFCRAITVVPSIATIVAPCANLE